MKTSNILEKVIIYLLQIVFIAGVFTAYKSEEKINYKAELQFFVLSENGESCSAILSGRL